MPKSSRPITEQHFVFLQQECVGKRGDSVVLTTWTLCKRFEQAQQNENMLKNNVNGVNIKKIQKAIWCHPESALLSAYFSHNWYAAQLLPQWKHFYGRYDQPIACSHSSENISLISMVI